MPALGGSVDSGEWTTYTKKAVEKLAKAVELRPDDPEARIEVTPTPANAPQPGAPSGPRTPTVGSEFWLRVLARLQQNGQGEVVGAKSHGLITNNRSRSAVGITPAGSAQLAQLLELNRDESTKALEHYRIAR